MVNSVNLQTAYPKYKMLLSNSAKKISKELGTKVIIEPTSKKICQKVGLNKEVANCLNTADFLKMVYQKIKEKGYRIPKIFISEEQSPREYNIAGQQLGNWNIYGPGRLEVSEPSLIIHECAHFLHNKNMPWNQPLYAIFCSLRSLFRPFLNHKEKEILISDFKRAYSEGYFKYIELEKSVKLGYIDEKKLKEFQKEPEKLLVRNAFKNVSEFIAEYFTLASQGFKFSPEITKRYEAFHGPEIKGIFTKEEINMMVKYRKKLEERKSVKL